MFYLIIYLDIMKKLLILPILFWLAMFVSVKTHAIEQKPCTREYMPVCGEVQVQCITTPCNPIQQTYSNTCVAENAWATILYQWECQQNMVVWWDRDEHGCIWSAGYSWDDTLQSCVRPWEVNQDLVSRAFDKGITSISDLDQFGFDSIISREQAAKMLVVAIEKSWLPIWTLKLPAWSCEWTDKWDIYPNLVDYVHKSCTMWLFKWDGKYFVPYYQFTKEHLDIVLDRASQYAEKISSYMMSAYPQISTNKDLTRWDMLKVLKWLYNYLESNTNKLELAQEDLNNAKAKRSSAKLTSYTMIQQRSCFCMEDYTRVMKYNISNGSIVWDVLYQDDNTKVSSEISENVMTIDQAFDMIQEAIDSDVDNIEVTYDNKLWYPKSVSIDRSFMIADEEMYYTFTILWQNDNKLEWEWKLSSYNNTDKSNMWIITTFDGQKMYTKICNNISATYSTDGSKISFWHMISTLMYCEDSMDLENAFSQIGDTVDYVIDKDNLTISNWTDTWKWIKK